MSITNLRRSDLNLLVVFDVLLELRSATRAAEVLHTTQPAISRSLARLRQILGDPLLVNAKGQLEPTPRALALRPALRDALLTLDAILDPGANSRRTEPARVFNIVSTSPVELGLTPELQPWLETALPGIMARFSTAPSGIGLPEDLLDSGETDLAIGRFAVHPARFGLQPVLSSRRVCLMRQDHPCGAAALTPQQMVDLDYLTISNMTDRKNEVDLMLNGMGLQRRIGLFVSHIGLVPFVLMKTEYAALVPEFAANMLARVFPLKVVFLTDHGQPTPYALAWHRRWDASPTHLRVREHLASVMNSWVEQP